MRKKRLALPQKPNLYLEPKWLRYSQVWLESNRCALEKFLKIISNTNLMVASATKGFEVAISTRKSYVDRESKTIGFKY